MPTAHHHAWADLPVDHPMPLIDRQRVIGEKAMLSRMVLHEGLTVDVHHHETEQFVVILEGHMRFTLHDGEDGAERMLELRGGDVLHVPSNVPHGAEALSTSIVIDIFAPPALTTGVDQR